MFKADMLPYGQAPGVQAHPYYNSYMEYNSKPWTYFNSDHLGNKASTSYSNITGEFPIDSAYRYAAGFEESDRYLALFSNKSIDFMSRMITLGLTGVHPEGKNIIVPHETIRSVADSVYQATGQPADVMQKMIVSYIIDDIKTEYQNTAKNYSYSAWVQKYDQSTGLRQFDDIKLNNKSKTSGYFQLRY